MTGTPPVTRNPSKSRRWVRGGLLTLGLGILAFGVAVCFAPSLLITDSGPTEADVLVVLGGGSTERPARAAELFKQHAAPKILLSGLGDCESNLRILAEAGVPADAVWLECGSHSTKENAQFSAKLIREHNAHRVIIVTTWYHSRRALACFRHYAPDIEFYSRPSYYGLARAEWSKTGVGRYVRAEFVKTLGYWICYGVSPL